MTNLCWNHRPEKASSAIGHTKAGEGRATLQGARPLGKKVATGEEINLVYFAPEFTETSTIKRVRQFRDSGWQPIVLGFERGRYNCSFSPEWPHVLLGRTRDKRYLSRLFALLAAIPVLVGIRNVLGKAPIFYARNIDQLILALTSRALFNRQAAVIYEILDIQPIFTGPGLVSRILRWVERRCLRRIQLLVVSSPAFHRQYYLPVQQYRGAWFVLENKLHPSVASAAPQTASSRQAQRPWRVGYFGLIRGEATLDLIARVAPRLRGIVEFTFRGVLTTIEAERFSATLLSNRNILYGGEYDNPRELADIYSAVDIAWAIDLEHADTNSRWLLPCRFYESGLFGVPCIAKRGFEIGGLIERLGVGWSLGDPLEDAIVRFFWQLTPEDFARKRAALRALPRDNFVAEHDAQRLSDMLCEHSRARSRQKASQSAGYSERVEARIAERARSSQPLL